MDYEMMLEAAHRMYGELSIESQVIQLYPDDDHVLAGARVTTPKGGYNGWAEGRRGAISSAEHGAIIDALFKANVRENVEVADEYYREAVVSRVLPGLTQSDEGPLDTVEEAGDIECAGVEGIECKNGGYVRPYYAGSITLSARDVADRTTTRHGRALCADCSSAAIFKRKK